MTGSYAAAGLVFLGLFLLGGAYSLFKQANNNNMRVMSLLLVLCAAMAIGGGVMRW
jgi:cbb3-type cytochrome oxidase subunit 3